jgi:hypothetical protein
MDPNAALRQIRTTVAAIRGDNNVHIEAHDLADLVADLVAGLDEWLVKGGLLPDQWRHPDRLLGTVVVVTRYGGHRHRARAPRGRPNYEGRLQTLCRSTSAWTLESWAAVPDHPLGLTPELMEQLPECERCLEIAQQA